MCCIYSDLAKILQNPLPGICVVPNEDDITKVTISYKGMVYVYMNNNAPIQQVAFV